MELVGAPLRSANPSEHFIGDRFFSQNFQLHISLRSLRNRCQQPPIPFTLAAPLTSNWNLFLTFLLIFFQLFFNFPTTNTRRLICLNSPLPVSLLVSLSNGLIKTHLLAAYRLILLITLLCTCFLRSQIVYHRSIVFLLHSPTFHPSYILHHSPPENTVLTFRLVRENC